MLLSELRPIGCGKVSTALLFCAIKPVGQDADSSLTIAVTDHSGAVIPFVDVLLKHVDSGNITPVNRTLEPVRVHLSPGTYEVLLAKNQYTLPLDRSRIYLAPGERSSLAIVAYLKRGSMLVIGRQIELPDSVVEYELVQIAGAPV